MSQFPIEKYFFNPYYFESHSMIISWLEKFLKGTKILDVGTATRDIKKGILLKSFELHGLEHEAEWLEAPRLLYRDILCWE
jgi:hypothetical protein